MNKIYNTFSLLLILFLFKSSIFAHMYEHKGIEILHPWATVSDGKGNANAYITISNNTNKDIKLENIIIKETNMIMLMEGNKMTDSILIPANSIRSIDDFYIMLHKLKNEFFEGDNFSAKLVFSSNIEIDIKFVVGEGSTLTDDSEKNNTHEDHKHH